MKQPNYLSLAQDLISLETVDGNHNAFEQAWDAIDGVLDTFKYKRYVSHGYESRVYFANGKMPSKFDVLLNSHIDVVPAEKSLFKPQVKGDKLFGRGAYDMKAAAAVQMLVFKELASSVDIKLGMQIVSDEERGGHNGTKYQFDEGLKAKFGVAGESGSDFLVKTKAKGIYWLKITFSGISAHAAKPWLGDNALYQASSFLSGLAKKYPVPHKESWVTTVTPSTLELNNTAINKIPDRVSMNLDVRFVPQDKKKVLADIQKLLPQSAEIEELLADGAHDTKDNHSFVQSLLQACESQKVDSYLEKSHGTGDMRFYTLSGASGVEFGPVGANAHNHEEWVSISSLENYYHILKHWLINLKK